MNPVDLPPGPPLPGAVQTVAWGLRPLRFFEACRRRYGPTFTMRFYDGTPIVVVSEPDDIRALFALGADQFEAGAGNAEILEPFLGPRSLLVLDGDEHRDERRRMQHAFRSERLDAHRQVLEEISLADIATWPAEVTFTMHDRMRAITLEVILRAVFGARGAQLAGLRAALAAFLAGSSGSPLVLLPALRRDLGRRSPWGRFVRQRAAVHEAVLAFIAQRRESPGLADRDDMLSVLLRSGGHDDQLLLDELMTLVLAGHDTTTTALAWTFDLLLHHRATLDRLRAELERGDDVYLDAVVHESLRVRPVIAEVVRTPTRPLGTTVGELPTGTTVLASIYLAHTDPHRYADPLAFRPERFLGGAPDATTWLPFGGGVRRCLGAGFAALEIREVLRSVVMNADLRAVDREMERPKRRAVTLIPRHGCRVELTGRR